VLDQVRLDSLYQYALATAASADDFRQRDLGPIHLLKYAYLADLAFAERHDGQIFSGVEWRFHHFGPWSTEAFERIALSIEHVGAETRAFGSQYTDDAKRYRLDQTEAEHVARRLEHELPPEITYAVSRAVRQHGSDTADLLRHVYLTSPMLSAKPGEVLDFSGVAQVRAGTIEAEQESVIKLSGRARKQRTAILQEARAEIQRRLSTRPGQRIAPDPAPRYDDVFFEGTAQLDLAAGEPLTASRGDIQFDDSVWLSSQRRDPDVS